MNYVLLMYLQKELLQPFEHLRPLVGVVRVSGLGERHPEIVAAEDVLPALRVDAVGIVSTPDDREELHARQLPG